MLKFPIGIIVIYEYDLIVHVLQGLSLSTASLVHDNFTEFKTELVLKVSIAIKVVKGNLIDRGFIIWTRG